MQTSRRPLSGCRRRQVRLAEFCALCVVHFRCQPDSHCPLHLPRPYSLTGLYSCNATFPPKPPSPLRCARCHSNGTVPRFGTGAFWRLSLSADGTRGPVSRAAQQAAAALLCTRLPPRPAQEAPAGTAGTAPWRGCRQRSRCPRPGRCPPGRGSGLQGGCTQVTVSLSLWDTGVRGSGSAATMRQRCTAPE